MVQYLPTFNPEINLGTIISLLTFVFLAGGFYASVKGLFNKVGNLIVTVDKMQDALAQDIKALNKVVTDVALNNQQLNNLEARYNRESADLKEEVRDLKHWLGFMKLPRPPDMSS